MSVATRFLWSDGMAICAADIAVARISAAGVRVHPSCRLLLARNAIARCRDASHRGLQPEYSWRLIEAHRCVLEFFVISESLHAICELDPNRLRCAISGKSEIGEFEVSSARDAQFELLVTALTHHAGILDVSVGEPDIRIKAGSRIFGVAAKRLTSPSKLRKRLRQATAQIRRNDDYGMIALNADSLLREPFAEGGAAAARSAFESISHTANEYVPQLGDGMYVAGICAFATLLDTNDDGVFQGFQFLCHAHFFSPFEDVDRVVEFLGDRGNRVLQCLTQMMTGLDRMN